MDETTIEFETKQETTKSIEELIKDSIREANTLPKHPATEKENLDIIKHLIKRLAIHQAVLEKKTSETNKLLLVLSFISTIVAFLSLASLIYQ